MGQGGTSIIKKQDLSAVLRHAAIISCRERKERRTVLPFTLPIVEISSRLAVTRDNILFFVSRSKYLSTLGTQYSGT